MANTLRLVDNQIYQMLKHYGLPISICDRTADDNPNFITGVITPTKTTISLKRALLLTARNVRQLLGADFNATFDANERVVIIRKKDLTDYTPERGDYIVWDSSRCEIVEIIDCPNVKGCYIIKTTAFKNDEVES